MSLRRQVSPVGDLLRRLLLGWLLAVLIGYLSLPATLRVLTNPEGFSKLSLLRNLLITGGVTLFLTVLSVWLDTRLPERILLAGVFAVLAVTALCASFSWAFLGICLVIQVILTVYCIYGSGQTSSPVQPGKDRKLCLWITAGVSVAFFAFVSAWTVGRVSSFSTPTYDFGIFSQMFYHMKASGQPLTTLERDGLLSHFAVHVSPIYYLLLPFYCLAPTPATLQVLQAAVITSAVIPLWKLGKHHGLSDVQRLLLCLLLLLYPAFSGGTSYDIHENCFLTPLLLWLLYGIDRKQLPLTVIAAALTLLVKEDAAVYVAVIGLWLTVKSLLEKQTWGMRSGVLLFLTALGYFLLVTGYLSSCGDGVMTYRYQNFMYDDSSSLLTVIKSVLLNPMKALFECVDPEKLPFMALTLLPLLGLPLLTRRYAYYILLIPYILINLMSDYRYQHDIFFQYTFGSNGLLLYLTAVNLAQLKVRWQRVLAMGAAVLVSALCFGFAVVPKAVSYPVKAARYSGYYQTIREALDQIPEDASVTATTFYTTYLSQRDVLYDVRYSSRAHLLETEYVVLALNAPHEYKKYGSAGGEDGLEGLIRLLEDEGYQCYVCVEDVLMIWSRGAVPE